MPDSILDTLPPAADNLPNRIRHDSTARRGTNDLSDCVLNAAPLPHLLSVGGANAQQNYKSKSAKTDVAKKVHEYLQ